MRKVSSAVRFTLTLHCRCDYAPAMAAYNDLWMIVRILF